MSLGNPNYIDYEDDESILIVGGDRVFRPCCRSTHRKRERKKVLGIQRKKNPNPSSKLDGQYTYYIMNRAKVCQREKERQARLRIIKNQSYESADLH